MQFISNTKEEREDILRALRAQSFRHLIANIPEKALLHPSSNPELKEGKSEMEVLSHLESLSGRNTSLAQMPSFLGAGAYHHFIPSAVQSLISRGEFLTAYTPYQAEASQGTLQATFEFQTMIADLYGMDLANASLYDGASAAAEAALLGLRETGRKKILLSRGVHPEFRVVIKTYCKNFEIEEIPLEDGATSHSELERILDENVGCVLFQSPNFLGSIEEGEKITEIAHKKGALSIVSADPISLGILRPPGDYGADIATGEGQSLGIPLNYGGPYVGLFSCKEKWMRKIPGRVVGLTKDRDGKRGFTLTLQTREQHIRREKATSNICTNSALNALSACVYLSLLGPEGLYECARLNLENAHRAAEEICKIPGFTLAFKSPFFNEFVVRSKIPAKKINDHLLQKGIIGGLPLENFYDEFRDCILYSCTETNREDEIQTLSKSLKELKDNHG